MPRYKNPSLADYARAGARSVASGAASAAAAAQKAAERARAAAEKEASRRKCDDPTPEQALRVLAKAAGVSMPKSNPRKRANPRKPRKRNPLRMNPSAAEHAVLAKAAQRHLSGVIAAAYAALKRPGGAATLFELGAAYEGLRREISYPGVSKPPGAAATLAGAKKAYALLAKHVG